MKNNNREIVSELIGRVQGYKDELEFLFDRKSKIKLELFYDTENQDLLQELEKIKERNLEINEEIANINTQLMHLLKRDSDKQE